MVMNNINNQTEQQKGIIVLPCYDELINFIKYWFPKPTSEKFQKPILEINRYTGTSAGYQEIVKWKVTSGFYGYLDELSVFTDDFVHTVWLIQIAGKQVKDKTFGTSLTMPFRGGGIKLMPEMEVIIYAHSDGVNSIKADASIVGREVPIA